MQRDHYDVLIVGAGPAGCVLANRLSADASRRVALLDAGPDYGENPADWPEEMRNPLGIATETHSWGHTLHGREAGNELALPRARVFGGTTTVNGCIWMRGSAADYDAWAAAGNPGWSFAELLPFFRLAESDPLGGELHGTDGPITVARAEPDALSPVDRRLEAAAAEMGLPAVADHNGGGVQETGIGPTPKNIAGGVRQNAALAYLAAARGRSNLTLLPEREVDVVCFDGLRATGVRLVDGSAIDAAEVILCAGAYGSPAILMRSGVGPASHLRELGIDVVADRPGVGENLRDHPLVNGLMECLIAPGHEPPARTFMPQMIKARSHRFPDEIDLHVYEGQSYDDNLGAWIFWLSISLQNATSAGHVRLTSRDPRAPLEIDHAYFADPADLEALCDGVEIVNRLVRETSLAEVVEPITERTLTYGTREELREKVRRQVGTTFHPSSTCAMGPATDVQAVVDASGRVHRIDGLRVVDASILPAGPRGNLHFPIVAAAEKIAHDILQTG